MGDGVVIAIIDTGCAFSHSNLAPNAWVSENEVPNNGIDDDGNGYVDEYHGYNFGSGNGDVSDTDGHGTHAASIAAGAGVAAVSGLAPHAKIMCLKVNDDNGKLFASSVFKAYAYAKAMGAHIVSNSFSNTYWSLPTAAPGALPPSQALLYATSEH